MRELTGFQKQAAVVGLAKLFNGAYFDICRLEALSELMGTKLSGPDHQALRLLHCVNWGDMSAELRQQTREKCLELLGLAAQEYIDVAVSAEREVKRHIIQDYLKAEASKPVQPEPKRSWALRLFGR